MMVEKGVLGFVTDKDIKLLERNPNKFWKGVEKIGDSAFEGNQAIKKIVIPSHVKSIGNSAFFGCRNLSSVEIEEGVLKIGNTAFAGCENLSSLKLPSRMVRIGIGSFAYCTSLKEVKFPEYIKEVHRETFKNCTNLEIITVDETLEKNIMPEPLKSINKETFYGCTSLKDLYFGKNLLFVDKTAFNETPNIKQLYFEFGKYEKSISFDSLGKRCYFSKYNIKVTSQIDSSKTIYLSYDKNNDAQLSAPIFEGYKVIGYYYKNVKIADGDGILYDQYQYFYDIEVTAKYEKE